MLVFGEMPNADTMAVRPDKDPGMASSITAQSTFDATPACDLVSALSDETPSRVVLRFPTWAFLGGIAAALVLFAIFFNDYSEHPVWLDGFSSALMVPLAIWLALGTGRFAPRAQGTIVALALVVNGRSVFVQPKETQSAEGVHNQIAMFAIYVACLSYVRWRSGWRIAREIDRSHEAPSLAQFRLKTLFQWTAFFAVAFLFWRSVSPHLDWESTSDTWSEFFVDWFTTGLWFVSYTLLTLLALSPSFITRLTVVALALTAVTLVVEQQILNYLDYWPHELGEVFLLMLGGALAGILAALPLRLAGYRFSN
jgi:hypothetical protein